MPISKEEISKIKNKGEAEISAMLKQLVSTISDKSSLEEISKSINDIATEIKIKKNSVENLINVELDKSINDGMIEVLEKINSTLQNSKSVDSSSQIITTLEKLISELLLNNKHIFTILDDISRLISNDGVSSELSQIKEYLGRNLEAEWDFYIDRNPTGIIERVRVKRIK